MNHTTPARLWPRRALAGIVRLGERTLRSPLGTVLERWEMRYRIRKRAMLEAGRGESSYGVDWYKAHTKGHRQRTLAAFGDRLRDLGAHAS